MSDFNGLGTHLGNLARTSNALTRSISPENFDGSVGGGGRATEGTGKEPARDLGQGLMNPSGTTLLPPFIANFSDIQDLPV